MENVKKDNNVWVDVSLSPSLIGKETAADLTKKVKDLAEEVKNIIPAGRISISISTEKEKFFQIEKTISNLIKSKSVYNERGFMRDPQLAIEFSKLTEHLRSINNIIDKRKKQDSAKFSKQSKPAPKEPKE